MKAEDEILVRACLRGDQEAFEGLFDRYERAIFNLALRMVNDRDAASDITQTTFARAWEKLDSFNFRHRFFSWLYRIAVNASLDHLGRRRPQDPLPDGAASSSPSPEEATDSRQRAEFVRQTLMLLSDEHRAVLLLKHYLDLSYEQMAEILEIPQRTVKSRLYEARRGLRARLSKAGLV